MLGRGRKSFAGVLSVLVLVAGAGLALYLGDSTGSASSPVKAAGVVNVPLGGNPFERLSEYNLFTDIGRRTSPCGEGR